MPTTNSTPLVLLDVDGVISDLRALAGVPRPWDAEVLVSHGFPLCIPSYMPKLVSLIASRGEVVWCTTWRERANTDIAAHLGLPPLPVIDDGYTIDNPTWKTAAAAPVAGAALAAGRPVIWIEDFHGAIPHEAMPTGVDFVDTAASGEFVLLPRAIPGLTSEADLIGFHVTHPVEKLSGPPETLRAQ